MSDLPMLRRDRPASRPSPRALKVAAGVFALTLSLVACSSTNSGDNASPTSSPTAGDTVRLVTYDAYAISDATLADSTKQTGIKVEVSKSGDGAEVVNRAILTKDNPEGDVLFGVDNNLLSRAIDQGLFTEYAAAGAGFDSGPVSDGSDQARHTDRRRRRLRELRPHLVRAEEHPGADDPNDLTKPEYKNLLVVENPATSTPGLAFLLATVAKSGESRYQDYWKSLRNNGVLVVND